MDWADDLAYSVSDTEDFYRAGLIPLGEILRGPRGAGEFVDKVFERWEYLKLTDRMRGRFELKDLRDEFRSFARDVPRLSKSFQDTRSDRAALRKFTSDLIGEYIKEVKLLEAPDSDGNYLDIPDRCQMRVKMLKELTWQYVIKNSSLAGQQLGQQKVVETLYDIYSDALNSNDKDKWDILPARWRNEVGIWASERNTSNLANEIVVRIAADAIAEMTDQQATLMYQRLTGTIPGGAFDGWAR